MNENALPLVSIIVRSMDRPTLALALDSVARQRYPNIEILVVAAVGSQHRLLPEEHGGRRLVFVPAPTRLGRSAAANAGLAAAAGELLGFLDDDDTLLPGHVETLVEMLQVHPRAVAAYARVRAENEAGELLHEFGRPFDPIDLHLQNYLPIHSVLFRREVMNAGARFDPTLDLCEDWDFWRQLALQGEFVFHNEVTAIYHIAGESGFAVQGNPEAARAAESQISHKWLGKLPESLAYEIVIRARAWSGLWELQAKADLNDFYVKSLRQRHAELLEEHADLAARHERLVQEHKRLESECQRLEARLESTIVHYENSRSLRITRPLRRAANLARLGRRAACGFMVLDWRSRLKLFVWLLRGQAASARRQLALASKVAEVVDQPSRALAAAPETWPEPPHWEPLPETVDILIPVYNGFEHLEGLFDSLARGAGTPFRLLVCDDASSDERVWPALEARVRQFPEAVLLRNSSNLGFVGTVNRLFEHVKHDFVLVNTDVQVPRFWLERLMIPIREDPSVASVTPFTNAGTICSFPHLFQDHPIPEGMSVDSIDAVFARLKGIEPPELTTGVGFCMAVRLEVAQRIGMFDPAFGKGYGEENDWCRRAQMARYRHVLVPNLFVHHKHGGSFPGAERQALSDRNTALLRQRYPELFDDYIDYIRRDPVRPLREFLHLRVLAAHAGRPVFVMIDNMIEGGAQAYSQELITNKLAEGIPVLQLIDDFRTGELRVHWRHGGEELVLNYERYQEWSRVLAGMKVEEILLSSIYSFRRPMELLGWLTKVPKELGMAVTVAVHDYFMICPSLFLIDSERRYCDLPQPEQCESCYSRLHTDFRTGAATIADWRTAWAGVMRSAARILVFSHASAELVMRIYPECAPHIEIRPHSLERFRHHRVQVDLDQVLHIGVVGSIAWHKGWGIVKALCEEIERRHLPYRVTVIGSLIPGFSSPCLRVTGRYGRDELADMLRLSGANVFFFTSICPETFSYVAHEIMACDVPFCCLDLGAPADSARRYAKGCVLSPQASAAELLERMEAFRLTLAGDSRDLAAQVQAP